MCWFQCGVTKSIGTPALTRGLGFLPGSNSVDYGGEPERRPFYLNAVARGDAPPGWGVDDGAGLLFRGTRLAEVVASRPDARAYRVHAVEGTAVEEAIEPRLLRARPHADPAAPLAVEELGRSTPPGGGGEGSDTVSAGDAVHVSTRQKELP